MKRTDAAFILTRDKWICQICGVPTPQKLRGMLSPQSPEVDHIVPKSRGGSDDPSNLRCACRSCNQRKLSFLDEELPRVFSAEGLRLNNQLVIEATARQRAGSRRGGCQTARLYLDRKSEWGAMGQRRARELHPDMSAKGGRQVHKLYPEIGRSLGRTHGAKGGRRRAQLHPGKLAEWAASGGRIGGRRNVESGHWFRVRTKETCAKGGRRAYELHPELRLQTAAMGRKQGRINAESGHIQRIQRIGAPLGGRRMHELYPSLIAEVARKTCHFRWHVQRNKFNPKCRFCSESRE